MSEPSSFGYVHPHSPTDDVVNVVLDLADVLTEIVQFENPPTVDTTNQVIPE